jgi:hypothetical protein
MTDSFSFDPRLLRYRNRRTGKIVGLAKIRELAKTAIANKTRVGTNITNRLVSGEYTLGQWEREMAREIKHLHLQQYKLSVGAMSQRDYGIVGARLRREYQYLRQFAMEIGSGRLSEAQIRQRVALYFNATWLTFERGRREANRNAGARWERRDLNSKVPCAQCPGYASIGWVPIGYLPNIGQDCDCRSNCKCTFRYAYGYSPPGRQSILTNSFGWINHGYAEEFRT